MKIASLAEVKAKLSAYVKASGKSPVVITRNGKAVAAIVALEDEDDLERFLLAHSPKLRQILSAARARLSAGKGIEHQQFWKSMRPSSGAAGRRNNR
jgi:prevent-host-death family protein